MTCADNEFLPMLWFCFCALKSVLVTLRTHPNSFLGKIFQRGSLAFFPGLRENDCPSFIQTGFVSKARLELTFFHF